MASADGDRVSLLVEHRGDLERPALVAGRRRWTSDEEHHAQVRLYDRRTARDVATSRRKLAVLGRAS
jgi:hypothetical protein